MAISYRLHRGSLPGLWSPIVGIDAFDLQEHEIDISPWLGLLCDGAEHTFSIKVAGLSENGSTIASISAPVNNSWSVTGKIFIWLDETNSITTGPHPTISNSNPTILVTQSQTQNSTGVGGLNETLSYTTSVSRTLVISSTITSKSGSNPCSWTQILSHSDDVSWLDFGNTQINKITTSGTDSSTGPVVYSRTYSYPMFANTTAFTTPDGNISLSALITRSKILSTSKSSIYPSGLQAFANIPQTAKLVSTLSGTTLTTTQNGSAVQFQSPKTNISFAFGSSTQEIRLGGMSESGAMGMEPDTELYFRSVAANNGTLTKDIERVGGNQTFDFQGDDTVSNEVGMNLVGVQQIIGRSPGLQPLVVIDNGGWIGNPLS